MMWILHSPLHGMLSSGMMVLTYTGRKTRREIRTPVSYLRLKDGRLMTTSLRSRTWWRNLRGGAAVTLFLQGSRQSARAQALDNESDVRQGFETYLQIQPGAERAFGLTLKDGKPSEADLQRLAAERVVIYFTLSNQ